MKLKSKESKLLGAVSTSELKRFDELTEAQRKILLQFGSCPISNELFYPVYSTKFSFYEIRPLANAVNSPRYPKGWNGYTGIFGDRRMK